MMMVNLFGSLHDNEQGCLLVHLFILLEMFGIEVLSLDLEVRFECLRLPLLLQLLGLCGFLFRVAH